MDINDRKVTQFTLWGEPIEEIKPKLEEKYIIPPFSVFDTKQDYWQNRKRL